ALGLLDGELVAPVAETHNLHVSAGRLAGGPVGADLLVDLEAVAPELRQRRAKPAQQPGVFGALVLGHDVTVGLEKHCCYVPSEGSAGDARREAPTSRPEPGSRLRTLASPALEFAPGPTGLYRILPQRRADAKPNASDCRRRGGRGQRRPHRPR